jgi:hypothetical protein
MLVPTALETLAWVQRLFAAEEIRELGIGGFDLPTFRPAMVGEEEAATPLKAPVDEAAKVCRSLPQVRGRMGHMQVEDHAGIGLPDPGKERLAVVLTTPLELLRA